jgi:peptide/nickel transport system ATP-binding protein
MSPPPVLAVDDFGFSYRQGRSWLEILHRISFSIAPGEVLGLVGESGCGKSSIAYNLLGYRRANGATQSGTISLDGADVLALDRPALDRLRGRVVAMVPQNPATALNPARRVGAQVREVLTRHGIVRSRPEANRRCVELFGLVGLPEPGAIGRRYPHQLSGGQQQRVCIAMALAGEPKLLVLDEPTTGLDVTTQKQIVDLLRRLVATSEMAMLYVTHDLALLAQIADRVGVMYAGHLVEIGPTHEVLIRPAHPYTRGLLAALPDVRTDAQPVTQLRGLLRRQDIPPGCPLFPRCPIAVSSCALNPQPLRAIGAAHEVACQEYQGATAGREEQPEREVAPARSAVPDARPLVELRKLQLGYGAAGALPRLLRRAPVLVIRQIDLVLNRGEVFALVGESGSGKSTIARALAGLLVPLSGEIVFEGKALPRSISQRSPDLRRRIQYIFQNPDESLNPRQTIFKILAQPLVRFFGRTGRALAPEIAQSLRDVNLDPDYARRYPGQLSGGERQRVAIARALIAKPDLLICDEVLSALDVSVQASVLELLRDLQRRRGLSLLFISHDLAVVRSLADRVGVLFKGELVACDTTEAVFRPPFHPYTQRLLDAVPDLHAADRHAAAG